MKKVFNISFLLLTFCLISITAINIKYFELCLAGDIKPIVIVDPEKVKLSKRDKATFKEQVEKICKKCSCGSTKCALPDEPKRWFH